MNEKKTHARQEGNKIEPHVARGANGSPVTGNKSTSQTRAGTRTNMLPTDADSKQTTNAEKAPGSPISKEKRMLCESGTGEEEDNPIIYQDTLTHRNKPTYNRPRKKWVEATRLLGKPGTSG